MTSTHQTSHPQASYALNLPYMQPAQAQKHITHNEALETLDRLVQMRIAAFDLSEPPADAQETPEQIYWTGSSPMGDWAGEAKRLAFWDGAGWRFMIPESGYLCTDVSSGCVRVFDGTDWVAPPSDTTIPESLARLGVNATPDDHNRLSVSADGSLFTHAGDDHRLTVNRNADVNTASVVFKTNYVGAAEFGLTGGTDFSLKVSPDGNQFHEALSVDTETGNVRVAESANPAKLSVHGGLDVRKAVTGQPSTPTVFDITASGTSGAPYTLTRFFSYSPTDWQGNYFMAYRARGVEGAALAAQAGDLIYAIDSYAHDGTTTALAARLAFHVEGDPANDQTGGRLILSLADGAGTQANSPSARVLSIGPDRMIHAEGGATFDDSVGLAHRTVSTLPSVVPAGQLVFVTDASVGAVPAYSDGTDWRSMIDGSLISAA